MQSKDIHSPNPGRVGGCQSLSDVDVVAVAADIWSRGRRRGQAARVRFSAVRAGVYRGKPFVEAVSMKVFAAAPAALAGEITEKIKTNHAGFLVSFSVR